MKELDFNPDKDVPARATDREMQAEYYGDPAPVLTNFSSLVKVAKSDRLKDSMVVTFESLEVSTEKAILLYLAKDNGILVDKWFPKGCCSNLDLDNGTVCIWDKIVNKNISKELKAELVTAPIYYDTWLKQTGEE